MKTKLLLAGIILLWISPAIAQKCTDITFDFKEKSIKCVALDTLK